MPPGLQNLTSGNNLETPKRKLEYYLALIEQKFDKGLEYQIGNLQLEGIISVTREVAEKLRKQKGDVRKIERANFNLRTKCSAALSLYEQPVYREIYIEKLNTIRPALRALISLLH
jgi:hypothetical protein